MLKTWDIFDTLIARRCIFPHLVFQIIELRTKLKGFAQVRIAAEQQLIQRGINYTLDDIYREIPKFVADATPKLCADLKNFECNVEIEQSIPITENILQVKSGDILISDMYLPENVVRKMLEKCGLIVPVEIIITSGGKSSGRIWQQISAQNQFVFHIGDNVTSDVKNPREFGFDSVATFLSQPNIVEKFFLEKDFNFAAYLREIRLKNPYTSENKRLYWEFFTINVAILIILVQLIDYFQKKYGFEYLGFCGRDTYYLWLLYRKFKEDKNETPPSNDYLYYSRKLVYNSKNELEKYFSAKIQNKKSLMIDLGGSGLRLNNLRQDMQNKFSILLCYCYDKTKIDNWISFDKLPEKPASANNFYFLENFEDTLEFFNRATHNTPVKMNTVTIGEKIVPHVIFSEVSDTENLDVFETCLQEILKSQVQWGGGSKCAGKSANINCH